MRVDAVAGLVDVRRQVMGVAEDDQRVIRVAAVHALVRLVARQRQQVADEAARVDRDLAEERLKPVGAMSTRSVCVSSNAGYEQRTARATACADRRSTGRNTVPRSVACLAVLISATLTSE